VGGSRLKGEARAFFETHVGSSGEPLCTSAEVLQELAHAYVAVDRIHTLRSAMTLVEARVPTVWDVTAKDVRAAAAMVDIHRELGARDLLHLAMCRRHGVNRIQTCGRALKAAFDG
jgi:predicted nucleic acid-binding protein